MVNDVSTPCNEKIHSIIQIYTQRSSHHDSPLSPSPSLRHDSPLLPPPSPHHDSPLPPSLSPHHHHGSPPPPLPPSHHGPPNKRRRPNEPISSETALEPPRKKKSLADHIYIIGESLKAGVQSGTMKDFFFARSTLATNITRDNYEIFFHKYADVFGTTNNMVLWAMRFMGASCFLVNQPKDYQNSKGDPSMWTLRNWRNFAQMVNGVVNGLLPVWHEGAYLIYHVLAGETFLARNCTAVTRIQGPTMFGAPRPDCTKRRETISQRRLWPF